MTDSKWGPGIPKPIQEVFDRNNLNHIVDQLTKTKRYDPPTNGIFFDPIEYTHNGVTYIIEGAWVPANDIMTHANSSCKKCNSKGYYVAEIMKHRLPNPQDYVVLSTEPLTIMSDEQKKLWVEKEKKKPTWRVMIPCPCAMKKLLKKDSSVLVVGDGNMMMRFTYKVK